MEFKLASFNLENLGGEDDAAPPLEARLRVLRPQLLRLDADILCLQEVNAQHEKAGKPRTLGALDQLLDSTGYAGFHRVSTCDSEGAPFDRHNLVILSRWPLNGIRQIRNDLVSCPRYQAATGEPAPREPSTLAWDRPLLAADVILSEDRHVHIINLHLRAQLASLIAGQKLARFAWKSTSAWAEGFFISAIKRAGQALEARLFIDGLLNEDPEALIAVCGDLNAEEHEMPLRILCADIGDSGNADLAERMMIPLERSLPDWRRFSVLHAGRKTMLDHILISQSLMLGFREIEVHNDALGDEMVAYASLNHSPESYHAPLMARFSL